MTNLELSEVIDSQIDQIFRRAYPSEAMHRDYAAMIAELTATFQIFPSLRIDKNDRRRKIGEIDRNFTAVDNLENESYTVLYHKNSTNTSSEERLTIIKNAQERVQLTTLRYDDGRFAAFINHSVSFPDFRDYSSLSVDQAQNRAVELVKGCTKLLKSLATK